MSHKNLKIKQSPQGLMHIEVQEKAVPVSCAACSFRRKQKWKASENLDTPTPALSLRQTLTLNEVHFNYPQRPDVPVLKGLNLHIDAGDQVALVGTSGAGKSTVASLLLRFHEPDTGALHVGETPASDLDLRGYRQRVAFVPQEVILFGGDLRSNIRYGRPDATEEEVIDAACGS